MDIPLIDLFRLRYIKGEALLQSGDSFPVYEVLSAMEIIVKETKALKMTPPIAIKQP